MWVVFNFVKLTKKEYFEKYRLSHLEYFNEHNKKYYKENVSKCKKYGQTYRNTHKNYYAQASKLYQKTKLDVDANFKILHNLRRRIHKVLKGANKSNHIMQLIGCNTKELRQYLEKQFKPGMSWDNYGTGWNGNGMKQWHIDHIIPCCKFNLSIPEEQKKCFNYKNLQPLWATENLRKGRELFKYV